MLILCDTHNGHRTSSGVWTLNGPLLTLGFVPCVHIQILVIHPIYNIQWWGKWWQVSFILCTSSFPSQHCWHQEHHYTLSADFMPFVKLFSGGDIVYLFWGLLRLLLCMINITVQLISFVAFNQYGYVFSQVGLEPAIRWADFFFYMNRTTHIHALPMGSLPVLPSVGSMWNARV